MTETTLSNMTFSQACDCLRDYSEQRPEEEASLLLMLEAERVVLDHRPRGQGEALIMLDTLIENLSTGSRSDGRDIVALEALRTWLAHHGVQRKVA